MQSMDIDFELHENGKNDVKVPFDEGEECLFDHYIDILHIHLSF